MQLVRVLKQQMTSAKLKSIHQIELVSISAEIDCMMMIEIIVPYYRDILLFN